MTLKRVRSVLVKPLDKVVMTVFFHPIGCLVIFALVESTQHVAVELTRRRPFARFSKQMTNVMWPDQMEITNAVACHLLPEDVMQWHVSNVQGMDATSLIPAVRLTFIQVFR